MGTVIAAIGGIAVLALILVGHSLSKHGDAPATPVKVSDEAAQSRCRYAIKNICDATVRCVPGLRSSDRLAADARGRCEKRLGYAQCGAPSSTLQALSNYDFDRCFNGIECDCDDPVGLGRCQPRLPDSCPFVSLPWDYYDVLENADVKMALGYVFAYQSDRLDVESYATSTFAVWAFKNLDWQTLAPFKSTTKPGLVFKDPSAEFGKTLCGSGDLIQITKQALGPSFEAVISLDDLSVVRLIAVGSSGQLVEHERARFCALVMGTHTYSNTGGGTTIAVDAVGMFDVPENRKNQRMEPPAKRP